MKVLAFIFLLSFLSNNLFSQSGKDKKPYLLPYKSMTDIYKYAEGEKVKNIHKKVANNMYGKEGYIFGTKFFTSFSAEASAQLKYRAVINYKSNKALNQEQAIPTIHFIGLGYGIDLFALNHIYVGLDGGIFSTVSNSKLSNTNNKGLGFSESLHFGGYFRPEHNPNFFKVRVFTGIEGIQSVINNQNHNPFMKFGLGFDVKWFKLDLDGGFRFRDKQSFIGIDIMYYY